MQACFPQPPFSPHSCQGHPSSHILDTGASCSQHLMRFFIMARMEPWLCSRHSGPSRVHPSLSVLNSNWGQPSPRCWSCSTPTPHPTHTSGAIKGQTPAYRVDEPLSRFDASVSCLPVSLSPHSRRTPAALCPNDSMQTNPLPRH